MGLARIMWGDFIKAADGAAGSRRLWTTGVHCRALSANGANDLAYRLLLNEGYSSWLYAVNCWQEYGVLPAAAEAAARRGVRRHRAVTGRMPCQNKSEDRTAGASFSSWKTERGCVRYAVEHWRPVLPATDQSKRPQPAAAPAWNPDSLSS